MSLRRPTVALLYFTFNESPFCDVAQTSDCGISFKSPLCGVAQTPDCGITCYLIHKFLYYHVIAIL